MLESGVLAGSYRPNSRRTQLIDALIESWTALFNHLGRPIEHFRWHRQANLPCCLKIDNQFKLSRPLHGKNSWNGTLQDLVYLDGGTPLLLYAIRFVAHEATGRTTLDA